MDSKKIYQEGLNVIPGGVNSPVRSFSSVDREYPVFIDSAQGSHLKDIEGNTYVDYLGSWGPMILGHNAPVVVEAVEKALKKGSSFGLPTVGEIELAEMIVGMVPSMEMVRLTTSGTEATMTTVRLSRAFTNRNKIVKCEGCYHGHSDSLLVKAGSGLLTSGHQDSNGITKDTVKDTLVVPFGDLEAMEQKLKNEDVACVIIEPVPANMGLIETEKDYLVGVRECCSKYGTLLVFDEVISGFRLAPGGAGEYYDIQPDLVTLGKIIGGGFPVGAFGGKREIMERLAPFGDVYHAGTLSGNPISVAAGKAVLRELKNNKAIYTHLESYTKDMVEGIKALGKEKNVPLSINHMGSLFTIFFTQDEKVKSLEDVERTSTEAYNIYFNKMLEQGVMVPPSKYEAHFVSTAHNEEDQIKTLEAVKVAFESLSEYYGG